VNGNERLGSVKCSDKQGFLFIFFRKESGLKGLRDCLAIRVFPFFNIWSSLPTFYEPWLCHWRTPYSV